MDEDRVRRSEQPDDRTGWPVGPIEAELATTVVETHLSRVFLTPDRAYKQLKPVTTSFVDLASREDRLVAASREHALNRRISPDVYLGTAEVVENDELAERLLVMRRLPTARRLDRLLDTPSADDHLRDVARLLAAMHAGQPAVRGDGAVGATREMLAANWDDAFGTLAPLVGPVLPDGPFRQLRDLVDAYLVGRGPLFAERIEGGWVRDGHGDLRAEHVFCLDDGPRLIDCLAFRDDLRVTDVLLDVAFLAMDLHRLAGPATALALVRHYDEFAAERHPSTLAHHYVAYRAAVRAKIAAFRHANGVPGAAAEVVEYLDLARQHLLVGQPRLVLVGGGAGVGKSTVAAGVADALGAVWLRADEVRKQLAGLSTDDHAPAPPGQGLYRPEFRDRVYDELLRQAALLLERGESVVLDATWSTGHRRARARELAGRTAATRCEIECRAPLDVARERIARRLASLVDPSDATPAIADHIASEFEAWSEADVVDTSSSIADSIAEACRFVVGAGQSSPTPAPTHPRRDTLDRAAVEFYLARIDGRRRRSAAVDWPGQRGRSR
ncbi:MAG: AAA family ATPase [Actinomycetota bacterium]